MSIKARLVIVMLFIGLAALAQQQLFLGLQQQLGFGITQIEQNKQVLKNKSIPWQINPGISLQYRIANKFSIETGISNNNLIWKVYDNDFKQRYNKRFESNLANKIGHASYFLTLQYAFELPQKNAFAAPRFIYVQFGGGYHQYGDATLTQQKDFVNNSTLVETVTMQTVYNKGSYYVTPEIGFQKLYTATLLSIGLTGAFNINNNMFTGSYSSVATDGSIVSQDKLVATGSYIGLNIRFHLSLWEKEKKDKQPKKEKIKNDTLNKVEDVKNMPTTSVTKDTIVKEEDTPHMDTVCKSVLNRDFSVTHTIELQTKFIKVKVWDNKEIDGDSIHLAFNDTWILKNYRLTKKPKIIELQLEEGVNNFVLYALNLGDYPPNTASVSVYDGKRWHSIVLESTLENCGTLQITYKP